MRIKKQPGKVLKVMNAQKGKRGEYRNFIFEAHEPDPDTGAIKSRTKVDMFAYNDWAKDILLKEGKQIEIDIKIFTYQSKDPYTNRNWEPVFALSKIY